METLIEKKRRTIQNYVQPIATMRVICSSFLRFNNNILYDIRRVNRTDSEDPVGKKINVKIDIIFTGN